MIRRGVFDIPPLPQLRTSHHQQVDIRIYPNHASDVIDNGKSSDANSQHGGGGDDDDSSTVYTDNNTMYTDNNAMHDNTVYTNDPSLQWLHCVMISNLPYLAGVVSAGQHTHADGQHANGQHANGQHAVEQRIVVAADGSEGVGLFMLDSGAGGSDAIVHEHVAQRLGLLAPEGEGHAARTLRVCVWVCESAHDVHTRNAQRAQYILCHTHTHRGLVVVMPTTCGCTLAVYPM